MGTTSLKRNPAIIFSYDELAEEKEEDLDQIRHVQGTGGKLLSAVARSPRESHLIVLGDSEGSDTTSQQATAQYTCLLYNNTTKESTLHAKKTSSLALLARRLRGKPKTMFCYGRDSSVESNNIRIQETGIAVRGQGSRSAHKNLTTRHNVASKELIQREHQIHRLDGKLDVLLLSDSDIETDEEAYNSGKTMELKESREASFHAQAQPAKIVVPSRLRKSGRRKKIQKYHCTVCLKSFIKTEVTRHPLLKVCVCYACKHVYKNCAFEKDEDGFEGACRWCGFGGDLVCCERCDKVFCHDCIVHNFGGGELLRILQSEGWLCFVCDTTNLKPLVAMLLKAREEIYRSRFDLTN